VVSPDRPRFEMSADTVVGGLPSAHGVLFAPEPSVSDHPWAQRAPSRMTWATKAVMDVVGASFLLVIAAPLMLATAALLRVRLGPGVIYRQRRVGLQGREFIVLKFRTMRPDRRAPIPAQRRAEDRRRTHKTTADPRHTTLGLWLRRLSIDELPQLNNVLRRDMSLVGPRPELPELVAKYEPWQHQRHLVRPGLTGLWQVGAGQPRVPSRAQALRRGRGGPLATSGPPAD
jgi:lipopolysaccharide/colanic/teichoic acid biosynthesis glycosyltransferase